MDDIKVGEYVRLQDGNIGIVADIEDEYTEETYIGVKFNSGYVVDFSKSYVKSHSPNIIDIIEVGDYVNGYKVIEVGMENKEYGKFVDVYCPSRNMQLEFLEHIFEDRLKSVVTHEQFDSMKYIVGGKEE